MGSVYARRQKLWIRYKGPDGKWTQSTTDYVVGQERQARKLLDRVEEKITAGAALGEKELGPTTVARYGEKWTEDRKKLGIVDWENDARWLRIHALPRIGAMPIADVRARHLIELFTALRSGGKLAPKSIYNVYSVLKALFRDAQLADLIDTSPCVLTKYQLGDNEDADPEWRATAIYSRAELTTMISDPRIPPDRQMLYALEGIGGVRHGEAAGLRWRHYDPAQEPLGRLVVATSYARGRTKTGRTRYMPVHPTLAAMLTAWKETGWAAMMGRAPTPEDLVVPRPPEHTDRRRPGRKGDAMRDKNYSGKRLREEDLPTLGFRHRRGHDLRRTMISLARTDGARKDLLELCTHNPKKNGSTIDIYTEFPWEALCAEVAKLKIARREPEPPPAETIPEAPAVGEENAEKAGEPEGSDPPFATRLATREAIPESNQSVTGWRRREWNSTLSGAAVEGIRARIEGARDALTSSLGAEVSTRDIAPLLAEPLDRMEHSLVERSLNDATTRFCEGVYEPLVRARAYPLASASAPDLPRDELRAALGGREGLRGVIERLGGLAAIHRSQDLYGQPFVLFVDRASPIGDALSDWVFHISIREPSQEVGHVEVAFGSAHASCSMEADGRMHCDRVSSPWPPSDGDMTASVAVYPASDPSGAACHEFHEEGDWAPWRLLGHATRRWNQPRGSLLATFTTSCGAVTLVIDLSPQARSLVAEDARATILAPLRGLRPPAQLSARGRTCGTAIASRQ